MTIRPYLPSDQPQLLELLRLNTPQYFAPEEEADLVHYLAHEREYYYVLEHNGTILGCGGINLADGGETAKISWDIFHPESQGKGLGTALTNFRIREMQQLGSVKTVSVRTSQLVYRFYQKFGLQLRETVKDYWAPGLDMYRLDCPITEVVLPKVSA